MSADEGGRGFFTFVTLISDGGVPILVEPPVGPPAVWRPGESALGSNRRHLALFLLQSFSPRLSTVNVSEAEK